MLTILRTIRHSLIKSGSARRYFLYAIGEIALVVIGILIALQINNWNQYRQDRRLEQATLEEILESLSTDIDLLQNQIKAQTHNWKQTKALLTYLDENPIYTQSLDELIMFPIRGNLLSLNTSAFELLESRGIDLIPDNTLRQAIVTHFKYHQQDFVQNSQVWKDIHHQFAFYYERLLEADIDDRYTMHYTLGSERLVPLDYEQFRSDKRLRAELKYRIHRVVREIAIIQGLVDQKIELRNAIQKYLNSK